MECSADTCRPSVRPGLKRLGPGLSAVVAGSLLLTASATAQQPTASEPLVLALAGVTTSRSAPPATVLWFLVAPGGRSAGRSAVARQSAARPTISSPDQPSTWAAFDGTAAPAALVALVSDKGLTPATVETATGVVERAIGASAASRLTRSAMLAKVASDLTAHLAAVTPTESGTSRLLEAQELRLNEGDIASARVGLVVDKQLDFGVGGSSYRVRFQLAGLERFRRAAPAP